MRLFAPSVLMMLATGACSDDSTEVQPNAAWRLLTPTEQPSSVLAAWAPSTDNVWLVGGREGLTGSPVVWHYDGTAWSRPDIGGLTSVDFWQVFGIPGGPVFVGGSNGTILRYDSATSIPTKITTPGTDIVFGLWGTSATDIWAVGGQTTGRGFVWRYQGTSFEPVTGLPDLATTSVWKVVGRSASDVYMSASEGLVLHWDGQTIATDTVPSAIGSQFLFSIGCDASRCVTAGSNGTAGVLYENDGTGWVSRVPTEDGPVWRGVTPVGDHLYVVGQNGAVLRDDGGAWVIDTHSLTTRSLHAAWADADGNLFAVGGSFDRVPTQSGVVLYKGSVEIPPLP